MHKPCLEVLNGHISQIFINKDIQPNPILLQQHDLRHILNWELVHTGYIKNPGLKRLQKCSQPVEILLQKQMSSQLIAMSMFNIPALWPQIEQK